MTASKQHPQRCETCKHLKNHDILGSYCEISGRRNQHGTLFMERVAELGCASHSSQPAAPAGLNTQPKECTCEDCQRFRHPDCPYPDSNITMDRCCAFMADIVAIEAAGAKAERERVRTEIQEKQRKKWTLATAEIDAFFESLRGGEQR